MREKHTILVDVASIFGMSVTELAEYVGYSRQSLYNVISNKTKPNKAKILFVIYRLETLSREAYEVERNKAEKSFKERQKLIGDLKQRINDI